MAKKSSIIRGTLILTMTGFLSRFMGFFYRIFMSHSFGEEGVGLYQLIFPVYALCYSLTTAGIETAISRTVACKVTWERAGSPSRSLYRSSLLVFPFLYQHDLSSRPCGIYCQSIIRRCTLSTASCNPLIHHAVLRSPQLHLRIQFRKEADKNPGALTIDRADRPDHLGIFLLFHDPKTRRYRLDCRCGRRTRTW